MQGFGYQELLVFFVLAVPYVFASLFLVPYVAAQKGRSGFGWALIALFLTPLLALLALAAVPELEEDVQPDDAGVPEFKWRKDAD
jgi:hypothetical protein